jgi:hypothetical protein
MPHKTPEPTNLPLRLSPYDPAIFWKIDWKALPVDCAFIIFGIAFTQDLFGESGIFTSMSPRFLLGMYLVTVISVSWFMGFILSRFVVYYNRAINLTARWIFALAGITLLIYLMAMVFPLIPEDGSGTKSDETFSMFATFMLVLGPFFGIGGYMTGSRIVKAKKNNKTIQEQGGADEMFYGVMIGLLAAVGFLVYMCQTEFVQTSSVSFVWITLIMLGSGFVAALVIGLLMMIKRALVSIGLFYKIAFILETSFPFIIISSLIFWNEVQKHFLSGLSPTGMIGILFFSGIIPFRVALIFNPPLRFINLIIGIASLTFYIFCLT